MSEVRSIDFKSVGIRRDDEVSSTTSAQDTPIGIKMPMQLGNNSDGIFAMNYTLKDEIRQGMKNLLLTNWGERLGLYRFGANLKPITMELDSEGFDSEMALRIKTAVAKWMPYVSLVDLQLFPSKRAEGSPVALIRARAFYSVPIVRIEKDAVEISFFIAA